jgi:hypothetical protein
VKHLDLLDKKCRNEKFHQEEDLSHDEKFETLTFNENFLTNKSFKLRTSKYVTSKLSQSQQKTDFNLSTSFDTKQFISFKSQQKLYLKLKVVYVGQRKKRI